MPTATASQLRRGRRQRDAAAIWSSCRTPSTPSPNSPSPNTAAAPRRRRWSPSAASRSPRRLAGLDTAFRADFGSGPLVVGICAEYDALPGIGHACGHNIIAASAVGTALALAEVADELGLTVALIGTPAEEAGGGKVLLLEAGAFDDIARHGDAAPRSARHRRGTIAGAVAGRGRLPRAGKRMRPSRRISASTPPTRSPSRRWRSGCCASSWRPVRWCTASSPTAARPPTSSPRTPRCTTPCAPPTPRRCASWRAGWPTASSPVRWPPAASTRSRETAPAYDELTP